MTSVSNRSRKQNADVAPKEPGQRLAGLGAVAAAQRFGFPVVMKILSPDIMHKSEIGGVLLDVADADAVRSGFPLLSQRGPEPQPRRLASTAAWWRNN
jgi:acyl-CoA synthetase (NDP forming)